MKKRIVAIFVLFTLLLGNFTLPVEAATLKLRYNGKNVTYTGKQIKIKINGKSKSISKTPGIMMTSSGYAMLPYYDTFVTSSIKMKKQYSKSTKKLVLTYNDDTLVMTVGKKSATFNGKSVTLPVAPVSVKYRSSGVTRILVPSRKVAELFGLAYEWNSSTSTVAISGNNSNTGSTSDSTTTQTSSPSYYYRNGKKYKMTKRNVSYNGTALNLTATPSFVMDGYNYISDYYTLAKNGPKINRSYNSSTKTITLTSTLAGNNNVLVMKIDSKKATINGKSITMARAPRLVKINNKSYVYVPAKIVGTLLGLQYSYNSSTKTFNYTPGLSIKYLGNYSVYIRTQVAIKANNIDVAAKIPGILEENTTLIPAASTFNKKYGLGVTYTYSNNTATFKRGDITVVTKTNSSYATVNGVSKKMTVPMRKIMLVKNGTTYVMVPGEFVCEALGLNYKYSSGTSYITTPVNSSDNNTNTGTTVKPPTTNPDSGDDSFKTTITMLRPSGVAKGTIVCSDDYSNNRLIITMKGNQTSFYSSNKPTLPSGVTFSTSYKSATDTTEIYLKTTTINGFRVKEDNNYIYIMNGKPTEVFKNVIVLDAGHGGSDSGAVGNGYKEKDFTLGIVLAAKKSFDADSNYKVYYTRLTDTQTSLDKRYTLANNVGADIFLSVHINSAGATATGTETLYNPDHNLVSSAGLSCYQLASITQKYVQAATGLKNRGLKQRCSRLGNGLAVLNRNDVPATLTEIGFISNPTEASTMAANLDSYGLAVYNAVVNASTTYPTNR